MATLLGGFGSYPLYFGRLRDVNPRRTGGLRRRPAGPLIHSQRTKSTDASSHVARSIVDARPIERYAAGHITELDSRSSCGTSSVPGLDGSLNPTATIVIVVDDDQDITNLVWQTLNVGFEPPKGRLAGWDQSLARRWSAYNTDRSHPTGGRRPRPDDWSTSDSSPNGRRTTSSGAIHVELGDIAAQDGAAWKVTYSSTAVTAAGHDRCQPSRAGRWSRALAVITGGPTEVTAALAGIRPLG